MFDRVVHTKADFGNGKDTNGGVEATGNIGKVREAVTHWMLLGSSVRPLDLTNPNTPLGLSLTFIFVSGPHTDESAGVVGESRPGNRIKTPAANSLVEGAEW